MARTSFLSSVLLIVLCARGNTQEHAHSPERLGTVRFATSCTAAAQPAFDRAVSLLHSFEFGQAIAAFESTLSADAACAVAQWGIALSRWGNPFAVGVRPPAQVEQGLVAVERARAIGAGTARERAYIDAVAMLYEGGGQRPQPARVEAYRDAMGALTRRYPDDAEAAIFYALSLTAAEDLDDKTYASRLQAVAILEPLFRAQPDHPGLAHYIIHSYDVPALAPRALEAAKRYALIAPSAPHALHMPSHIFLQLGMWPEAVASNEASWKASTDAKAPDFHSLHWLLYAYLQQGRADDARPLFATVRDGLANMPKDDVRNQMYGAYIQATMTATFLVETKQWDAAPDLLPPEQRAPPQGNAGGGPYQAFAALAQAPAVFARGLASAMAGAADAQQHITTLQAIRERLAGAPIPFAANMAPVLEIQALEIAATADAARGDFDAAFETMRRATALEEAMPVPPGPPPLIKPSHELFGEILLRAGQREEAMRQFATSLFRHPGRARSLEGAAQAAQR
jgi:tetratricopeptide (TPR) repeat protein